MAWYLAASLMRLRNEINGRWPNRDKASDGSIGNAQHCPGTSDHCADGKGCVHAIDIDKDGIDPWRVVTHAIKHPATQYVIFDRKIWSRSRGFRARAYNGLNPHTMHIHVSIQHTAGAENSTAGWLGSSGPTPPPQPAPSYPAWPGVYLRLGSQGTHVHTVQARLQQRGWRISVDGSFGPETDRAVKAFQAEKHLLSDGIVGPLTWKALWVAPITSSQEESGLSGEKRIDVVALGGGNQLYQKYYRTGIGWSDWGNLGAPTGGLTSDPAICSWEPRRWDVFARGANNQLVHKWFASEQWFDWEDLGGILTSGPAAVASEPERIDVVALGGGNQLYQKYFRSSVGWSDWGSLGAPTGGLTSDPAICSWEPRRWDTFARGANNQLVHKWFANDQWSDWEDLGGTLTSGPSAVAWEPGRIDVVALGGGNQLYQKYFRRDVGWSDWVNLGAPAGGLTSDPSICSWEPRRLDIFARGANNQLVHKWFNGSEWSDWEDLGGILSSGPDATSEAHQPPKPEPPLPTTRAQLAARIRDSNRIALLTSHISRVRDQATASQNIADTAAGKEARLSSYDNAPGGSVYLDTRMLRGMLELAKSYSYRVTEIAGGSHSRTSRHYVGVAFDVDIINGQEVNGSNDYYRAFMQRCRDLGATEVLGPGDPDHSTHVHSAWPRL